MTFFLLLYSVFCAAVASAGKLPDRAARRRPLWQKVCGAQTSWSPGPEPYLSTGPAAAAEAAATLAAEPRPKHRRASQGIAAGQSRVEKNKAEQRAEQSRHCGDRREGQLLSVERLLRSVRTQASV